MWNEIIAKAVGGVSDPHRFAERYGEAATAQKRQDRAVEGAKALQWGWDGNLAMLRSAALAAGMKPAHIAKAMQTLGPAGLAMRLGIDVMDVAHEMRDGAPVDEALVGVGAGHLPEAAGAWAGAGVGRLGGAPGMVAGGFIGGAIADALYGDQARVAGKAWYRDFKDDARNRLDTTGRNLARAANGVLPRLAR